MEDIKTMPQGPGGEMKPTGGTTPLSSEVMDGGGSGKSHHKPLKILLIILVVIIAAWGVYVVFNKQPVGSDLPEESVEVSDSLDGGIVSEFPKELLPTSEITILNSDVLEYPDSGRRLSNVSFTMNVSFGGAVGFYKTLLLDGGWTITRDASVEETPTTFFSAVRGDGLEDDGTISESVNVSVTSTDSGVKVQVAYVLQN